jgi:hypothetical protein
LHQWLQRSLKSQQILRRQHRQINEQSLTLGQHLALALAWIKAVIRERNLLLFNPQQYLMQRLIRKPIHKIQMTQTTQITQTMQRLRPLPHLQLQRQQASLILVCLILRPLRRLHLPRKILMHLLMAHLLLVHHLLAATPVRVQRQKVLIPVQILEAHQTAAAPVETGATVVATKSVAALCSLSIAIAI